VGQGTAGRRQGWPDRRLPRRPQAHFPARLTVGEATARYRPFTGAHARKIGLVEAADRGTLFLDEIGDVPLALQVKLLRLLETGTYRRVGSVEPKQADFRLVTATHRNLYELVEKGAFRRDLYYRISRRTLYRKLREVRG
jgi:DNA-binding NtrC family response regulator